MKRAKGIVDKNGMKWAMAGVPADRTAPNGFREKPKAEPLLDKSKATAPLQYYGNVTVNPDAGKVTIKMPKRDAPAPEMLPWTCPACSSAPCKCEPEFPCLLCGGGNYHAMSCIKYKPVEPKPAEPSCVCAETGARNCPVHNEPAADERPAREWWLLLPGPGCIGYYVSDEQRFPDMIRVREVKK